jgi:hypothetical protein
MIDEPEGDPEDPVFKSEEGDPDNVRDEPVEAFDNQFRFPKFRLRQ